MEEQLDHDHNDWEHEAYLPALSLLFNIFICTQVRAPEGIAAGWGRRGCHKALWGLGTPGRSRQLPLRTCILLGYPPITV